jgi:hypothetical protein
MSHCLTEYTLRLHDKDQSVDTVWGSNRFYFENCMKLLGHKYTMWKNVRLFNVLVVRIITTSDFLKNLTKLL